jgi:hypothetical protein
VHVLLELSNSIREQVRQQQQPLLQQQPAQQPWEEAQPSAL